MSKKKDSTFKRILTELVMDHFAQNGGSVFNYKQVAAKLGIDDNDTRQLVMQVMQELVFADFLEEAEVGKYRSKAKQTHLEGTIQVTSDGSAYFKSPELTEEVYIAPRKVRRALDGDTVKIFIFARRNGKHLEGEVLDVIKRARTDFTGILQISKEYAFLVPDNRKMQHDIFIPVNKINGGKHGEKAVARIVDWPEGAKNPIGEIIHVLGKQGQNETEMNAILADFGFPLSFPAKVEEEVAGIPNELSAKDLEGRRDFRKILTFTIDPVDAKDFDDAISFQVLKNGHFEIGVHIADVTHYLHPFTALDKEAYERATSVYLVDRVIPMLPEKLSNNLCSLVPNQDRLTFSAVFEMDENGQIFEQWFGKTVIHSARRFSYEQAQEVLEGKSEELKLELNTLNAIAYKLREQRFSKGAMSFETTEVKFKLDADGRPLGVYVKERKDAHKLIEDFMLLANRKVAEFITGEGKKKNKKAFVYRIHDEPEQDVLANFGKFAARFGYKISTKSRRDITGSLNKMMQDVEGKKEQNVLTSLAIRAMAKAIYSTKNIGHYGLAFDHYSHFTSPIRRYPDVLAHRLLSYYLAGNKSVDEEELERQCNHCSQMEKKAAEAERASVKYKQAEFLQDHIGTIFKGLISGVTEWGMYVEITENKCEGMVRLRDLSDDFYVLDPQNYCVIGQRRKKRYQLGDEVRIKVKKVDLVKRQIDFTLVS